MTLTNESIARRRHRESLTVGTHIEDWKKPKENETPKKIKRKEKKKNVGGMEYLSPFHQMVDCSSHRQHTYRPIG